MTATDELRRLLDERGVEWIDDSYAQLRCTVWHGYDGKQWRMTENMSGMLTELKAWQATPEQAIEATLGRGECEILGYDDGYDEGCDGEMYQYADPRYFLSCEHEAYGSVAPKYCPECGRKVVGA